MVDSPLTYMHALHTQMYVSHTLATSYIRNTSLHLTRIKINDNLCRD